MRAQCIALVLVGLACSVAARAEQDPLVVALLQLQPAGNDLEANAREAERACGVAAEKGADIALLPEMWSIGYTRFDPEKAGDQAHFYSLARATSSDYVQHFAALAKKLNMAIAFTYLQAYDPLPRNAVTLFDRHGKEVFTYAKVHTSDFKSMERSMTPGDAFQVGTLNTAKGDVAVGAMICFDREQPESARILMLKGAEIVLTPNACGLDELRLDQFKIRAWENVMGVAMANYPAPKLNGRSVAYAASGEELVLAKGRPGVFLATFDLDDLRDRRRRVIWGNAYRRPHRYTLLDDTARDAVWNRTDGLGLPYDPEQR